MVATVLFWNYGHGQRYMSRPLSGGVIKKQNKQHCRNNSNTVGTIPTLSEQFQHCRNNSNTVGTIPTLTEQFQHCRNNSKIKYQNHKKKQI